MEVAINSVRKGGWFLLNGQMAGYFRVQYDPVNYERLSEQLLRKHSVFPDLTRSQLIDDAFVLAEADLIDYGVPLKLIKYLKVVDDEMVATIVFHHLTRMKELCLSDDQKEIYHVRNDQIKFFILFFQISFQNYS